jgi:two-component system chemotaxis response regulator CheY
MLRAQFKILVADADADVRKVVSRGYLMNIGFRSVIETKDAEMAWDRLDEAAKLEDSIRLVLADWDLPRGGGVGLLKKLRADERFAKTPFIMLTGHIDRAEVESAAKLGVNDFLTKPLKIATVREKVSAFYQASLPRPAKPSDLKILMVDDDEDVLNVAVDTLLRMGFHNIRGFPSADAAWADLLMASGKSEPYELIISDWTMPHVSGLDLLTRVRAHPVLKHTPFFMLTAQAERNRVIEAVEAGASGFITKPFRSEIIRQKLAAFAAAHAKHPETLYARWRQLHEVVGRPEPRLPKASGDPDDE